MNIRAKTEREIVKNINQASSLQELFLISPASKSETNMIMMKLLNQNHHMKAVQKSSNSMLIVRAKAA